MCGRIEAAIAGFTRALQLEPANTQAKEKLLALRQHCLRSIETASAGVAAQDVPKPTLDATVLSFLNAIEQIPLCDPTLAPSQAAKGQSRSDSSYYVRESYRLFRLPSESAKQQAIRALEQAGNHNYRYWVIAALAAFEKGDSAQAMQLLRAASDRNPADLYVERVRIEKKRGA